MTASDFSNAALAAASELQKMAEKKAKDRYSKGITRKWDELIEEGKELASKLRTRLNAEDKAFAAGKYARAYVLMWNFFRDQQSLWEKDKPAPTLHIKPDGTAEPVFK